MKKNICCLLLALLLSASLLNAQPWKAQVQAEKRNPNFFEIQRSFNEYWKDRPIEKGKGWKPFKRWEWFMESRVDEQGYLDGNALWKAWEVKQERFSGQVSNASDWTNLGPQRVIPVDGGAGRLNCITFDPQNNNIIWVGAASGGLWKSTDGGQNWTSNTDRLPVLGVSALAINPKNNSIMYLATGDGDAGDTYSIGVLKSTDAGETWNTTGLSWAINNNSRNVISSLYIDPVNPDIILAAASNGLYRTTDAGKSWILVIKEGSFKEIDVNPSDPSIIYAARMSLAGTSGIFKSTNGGAAWTALSSGLPTTDYYRISLAVSRSNPSVLYALYSNDLDDGFYGLYKSSDGGTTWSRQSNSPNLLGWETDGSDAGGQGWYDLALEICPTDPNIVYVGGVNIWKSTNSGVNWVLNAHWYGGGGKPYVHADHHQFAVLPGQGNVLFSCNDGGLFKTTNGGASWTDLSNGLGIQQFYRIGISKSNPGMVIGGSQDNGTNLLNGSWKNVMGGDGMESLIDPANPNIMYAEYYYGSMYRSTNGGLSFTSINSGVTGNGAWVSPFVISPKNSSTIFRGTTNFYKSTNRGSQWTKLLGPVDGGSAVSSIAIAPSDENYIYVANRSYLYRTTNGGVNWTKITSALPQISYIAVHPGEPLTIWTVRSTYSGGSKVSKSTDGGITWIAQQDNLPEIPVNCVAVHPRNGKHVYIGTDLGVFFSSVGGGQWQEYNSGLPNVIINELEIDEGENRLYAGTYGRGLWSSPLENPSVPVELISLKASGRAGGVLIEWSTATETNNRGFEIERKTGDKWAFAGFVKGKGTVTERNDYRFTDKNNIPGKAIYRIKQIDYDGRINFAKEISAEIKPSADAFMLAQNYPNPFNPVTTIRYSIPVNSPVTLKVFDMTGREVSTLVSGNKEAGSYEVKFDASKLTSGIYLYEMRAGNYTETRKLAVIK